MALQSTLGRRDFLAGRSRRGRPPHRPPWSLPGAGFDAACRKCDACIDACPETILRRDEYGYPRIDFTAGGCSFCGHCVQACRHGALSGDPDTRPWQWVVELRSGCLSYHHITCRSCAEHCDREALRLVPVKGGMYIPVLDESLCTGCGYCIGVCPVNAIRMRDAVYTRTGGDAVRDRP